MVKIGIITGSTRDARVNLQVAEYVLNIAQQHPEATFEIVDIKDYNLPRFNEDLAPLMANRQYQLEEVRTWSQKIDSLDGFIFVTPEYNKSITSSLKDAIDHIAPEWNHKAAAIVSYGSTNGIAASYSLRQMLSTLKLATISINAGFNLYTDFEQFSTFKPAAVHEATVKNLVNEVALWATAMKTIR
ncbi:MAG: NAD(P)H-dependent oxidoreductase [Aerococcaceae bacterium]|nr:NAD(P)H-dependent oxidoreductase [Aerococcaceae bacterium]